MSRDEKSKDRPSCRTGLDPDPAAMGIHDGAADGQSQPHPQVPAFSLGAIKFIEHPLFFSRREPWAAVGNGDDDALCLFLCSSRCYHPTVCT